ncbi:hypothetical protein AcV7_003417 [Taiwanofungus camphoratus]|nr:hypothetical protein AcV7_003417 [Antrodia cinnamomea]
MRPSESQSTSRVAAAASGLFGGSVTLVGSGFQSYDPCLVRVSCTNLLETVKVWKVVPSKHITQEGETASGRVHRGRFNLASGQIQEGDSVSTFHDKILVASDPRGRLGRALYFFRVWTFVNVNP